MGSNVQKIVVLCVVAAIIIVAGFFLFNNGTTTIEQQENGETEETEQTNNVPEENMENSTSSENFDQESNNIAKQENRTEDRTVVQLHTIALQFSGTGFGYPYQGTFKDIAGEIELANDTFVKATFRIEANSVDAGNFLVNSQLKGEDFLNVHDYPEILLTIDNVEFIHETSARVSAHITIRGVTNSLEFPATISNSSLSADFTLDVSQYGITHPNVDKQVRMQLSGTWPN